MRKGMDCQILNNIPIPMNRVILYIIGTILVIAGAAYTAATLGVEQQWIVVGCLVILGLGIMGAATGAKGTAKTNVIVDE